MAFTVPHPAADRMLARPALRRRLPSDVVKLLRRRPSELEPSAEVASDVDARPGGVKGRPTPKRRDATSRKPPITQAPRTRREAMQWQREQNARAKARGTAAPTLTGKARVEAMRRGDPAVLPRRDQGPVRKLARDWVDSRRMGSNFLLLLFPLMIIGYTVPYLSIIVLVVFVAFLAEWFLTGKRIRALAVQRFGTVRESAWSIGFYAGARAYLPRRWRVPRPQVGRGDPI